MNLKSYCIILLLLATCLNCMSAPDWNTAKRIHLVRGHESSDAVIEFDFYYTKNSKLIIISGPQGVGRYLRTKSASLYDFTPQKGIVSQEDGRNIVMDTSSILNSKATEVIYLLSRAIDSSPDKLPDSFSVSVTSDSGGEKIMITPGDSIRYKRPWKLTGNIEGKDKVTYSLIQTFGDDTEGTTFRGHVNFKPAALPINPNEALDDWLIVLDKTLVSGAYESIEDILKIDVQQVGADDDEQLKQPSRKGRKEVSP